MEKVINPNGGLEEKRFRVAKVKLMRQFKLDFEVLVDNKNIDPEIALATAFISMFTQWGLEALLILLGLLIYLTKLQKDWKLLMKKICKNEL